MNYHNITKDDMLNGDGLRIVLWVSGCEHHCPDCQNMQTWEVDSGIEFDEQAKQELYELLNRDYISGLTFSGGDPLNYNNIGSILDITSTITSRFGDTKTIWLYTGYTWEEIFNPQHVVNFDSAQEKAERLRQTIVKQCDVLVDGRYIEELKDPTYPWAGSTNQRVIDVQKSLQSGKVVLWNSKE